jgi:predicted N-acetyltransferase YhbS
LKFKIEPLQKKHDRTQFNSNSEALNRYFHQQVSQDIRRKLTTCYVAVCKSNDIAGFFTLSSASIFLGDLPLSIPKKLPRYPTIPAVRMGRLAVDRRFNGKGLGGALLAEALVRSAGPEIAAFALVVDAKDEVAFAFYEHHGFIPLETDQMSLFFPLNALK